MPRKKSAQTKVAAKKVKAAKSVELSADNLKNVLWDTLLEVKAEVVKPQVANAIAKQSNEICKVTKLQMDIMKLTGRKTTAAQSRNLLN